MVDCCARCGNIQLGQQIVHQFVHGNGNRHVNVQTKTALMKGYAHSGDMHQAHILFDEMVSNGRQQRRERPNVRTLNTLLRGCLWAATSVTPVHTQGNVNANNNDNRNSKGKGNNKGRNNNERRVKQYPMSGGIITADAVWPNKRTGKGGSTSSSFGMDPDTSSYEYYISLLSQALRCDDALLQLAEYMQVHKITHEQSSSRVNMKGSTITHHVYTAEDPSVLETLGVSFLNLAKGYGMLGKQGLAMEYAGKALNVVNSARELQRQSQLQSISTTMTQEKLVQSQPISGGKRGWKDQSPEGTVRRDVSNTLFRAHKLNELEGDAKMILDACDRGDGDRDREGHGDTKSALDLAKMMVAKVMYFSGGGTTDLSASRFQGSEETSSPSAATAAAITANAQYDRIMLMNALWYSFGLSEAMKCAFPPKTFHKDTDRYLIAALTDKECAGILTALGMKASHVLMDDGTIDFSTVFARNEHVNEHSEAIVSVSKRDLNIELGSGFGEWAVHQSKSNPASDYIAVEMRSDRVGQMFSKSYMNGGNRNSNSNGNGPLSNLCCVGAECGSFLRSRVKPGSVANIFVNHPEPPTQTIGANSALLKTISEGGEEPAHMLSSETLISAARCLDDCNGKLIIVTDNRWYANLICATLLKVMKQKQNEDSQSFYSVPLDRGSGFVAIETFNAGPSDCFQVTLYEGQPNESIGHLTASTSSQKGSTYFDRLWRKGAGTHADAQKRFTICMCRSSRGASAVTRNRKPNKGAAASSLVARASTQLDGGRGQQTKNKKRSAAKQQRRNERRMMKKNADCRYG
jgi:pentatricopeptide repeat protein